MTDKFEAKIIDQLRNQKSLSDTSISAYMRNLKKLNDNEAFKNFKFLENTENILKKLEGYKENTKRNYLISVVSVLSVFKDKPKTKKLHDIYYNLMMDKKNDIDKSTVPHQMTERQKENWMDLDEIKKVYLELKSDVDEFSSQKNITEQQYNKLLSYFVLSLYLLEDTKRNKDYQLMYIVKKYAKSDETDKYNYLDLTDNKFIFNQYKTSKKYGTKIIDIKPELRSVIDLYLKYHPLYSVNSIKAGIPLLVSYSGTPLNKVNSITRILNRTFGKLIGSSMIRHIYLSGTIGPQVLEHEKIAGSMGHSVAMQSEYVKFKDNDNHIII